MITKKNAKDTNVPMSEVWRAYISVRQDGYTRRLNGVPEREADAYIDGAQDMLGEIERFAFGETSEFEDAEIKKPEKKSFRDEVVVPAYQ